MKTKLYNGNCIEVLSMLPKESIDLIVTDPPYRLTTRGGASDMGGMYKKKEVNKGNVFKCNDTDIEQYIELFYDVLKDGTHCYIMCNNLNLPHFIECINNSRFKFIKCLIWDKCNKICGKWYMSSYEYIIMLRKGEAKPINDCGVSDILTVPNIKTKDNRSDNIHDSQKPIELMEILVAESSNVGDVVLDPFMGSGTTGIACVNKNRSFVGIELDESYFNLSKNRIEKAESQIQCKLF